MSDRYDNQDYSKRMRVSPSRAYHKYWQGYTERTVIQPNGKAKIERYYAAPWKQRDLSLKMWVVLKLLYFVLTTASVVLFLLATTWETGSNRCWYSALAGLPAGLSLFWLIVAVLNYMVSPRKMTLGEYNSHCKLRWIALAATCLLILAACGDILYFTLSAQETGADLLCAALLVLAGALCAAMFLLESRLGYQDIPNQTQLPDDCLPIR